MNMMLEALEGRRLMSANPVKADLASAHLSTGQSFHLLPYVEQDNVYKQAGPAQGAEPQGIIAILIGLLTSRQSQETVSSDAAARAGTSLSIAVGDVNGDGRADVFIGTSGASQQVVVLSDVMVSSFSATDAFAGGVFVGATTAQVGMIGNGSGLAAGVTDGTSNTLIFA